MTDQTEAQPTQVDVNDYVQALQDEVTRLTQEAIQLRVIRSTLEAKVAALESAPVSGHPDADPEPV